MVAVLAGLATAVVALFHALAGLLMAGQACYDLVIVPVLWVVGL
jgi:hypothetical protein